MTLTLSVLRCPDSVPPETKQLNGGELRIGRGTDNDWIMPDADRLLSKKHCVIAWLNGAWMIADTSTNGTYLNRETLPLGHGQIRSLADGDHIRFGAYEIEARIISQPAFASTSTSMGTGTGMGTGANISASINAAGRISSRFDNLPAASNDIAPPPPEPLLPAPASQTPAHTPTQTPTNTPTNPPAQATAAPALLAAFLAGAGMDSAPDHPPADPEAMMRALGAALRATISGIRQTLIARAAIKGEFRIEQTMIRARGNNPLKFSADDDDALAALLGIGRRMDMSPASAINDAMRDMRLHELATMAAMQGAVRALLARLDPAPIRAEAEQSGGISVLPAQKKARAFEAYEKLHETVTHALSDDFESVFGKSFARAYEIALRDISAREP